MLAGTPASPGFAVGPIYKYTPFQPEAREGYFDPALLPERLEAYRQAKEAARLELRRLISSVAASDPDKAKIFTAHEAMLDDDAMEEEISSAISGEYKNPDFAIFSVYDTYIDLLGRSGSALSRERTADLIDVRNRLLRNLCRGEEKTLSCLPSPVIVAACDLLPSDTASLDRKNVLGIVTEAGGLTSHSAIIARSFEIPAVLGIFGLMDKVEDGQTAALDAVKGTLILEPSDDLKSEYTVKRERHLKEARSMKECASLPAVTRDGVKIEIEMNVGSAVLPDQVGFCDGIGLLRTEFLFMEKEHMPSEEEQFSAYRSVLSAMAGRPVLLRTLDIGGDKTLRYLPLPKEDNPFLGTRAIRLCFERPELFRTQLRAALRASVFGELWLMLPMIGALEDWRRAKAFVDEVRAELLAEGTAVSPFVKLGAMAEIPSLAFFADGLAREADFASLGTNDLCQYLFAADRMNPAVSRYARSYSPALFRAMKTIVSAFNEAGKPVSVCGELGGDPIAVPALIGLGLKKLSMSPSSFGAVKRVVTRLFYKDAVSLAGSVLAMDTEQEARAALDEFSRGL